MVQNIVVHLQSSEWTGPDYIRDLLRFNISGRTLRSSNNRLINEPRANLKTYGESRAFSVAAPRLWNKLPLQIRISSSEAVLRLILRLIFISVHLICSIYLIYIFTYLYEKWQT